VHCDNAPGLNGAVDYRVAVTDADTWQATLLAAGATQATTLSA
jgi:hypothetical protein